MGQQLETTPCTPVESTTTAVIGQAEEQTMFEINNLMSQPLSTLTFTQLLQIMSRPISQDDEDEPDGTIIRMAKYLGCTHGDMYESTVSYDAYLTPHYAKAIDAVVMPNAVAGPYRMDRFGGEIPYQQSEFEVRYRKFETMVIGAYYHSSASIDGNIIKYVLSTCLNEQYFDITVHPQHSQYVDKIADLIRHYVRDHNYLKGQKITLTYGRYGLQPVFIEPRDMTWDNVILPTPMRDDIILNTVSVIERSDELKSKGLPRKRGVMLVGKPGTGKTLTSTILTHAYPWTVIILTPDITSHGPDAVRFTYDLARQLAPTMVVVEDLDLIGSKRNMNASAKDAILGELLNQLDGVDDNIDIITVATTNENGMLDAALGDRPGRFDLICPFDQPSPEAIAMILKKNLPEQNDISFMDLKNASELAHKLLCEPSGSMIREIVITADQILYKKNQADGTDYVLIGRHLTESITKLANRRAINQACILQRKSGG